MRRIMASAVPRRGIVEGDLVTPSTGYVEGYVLIVRWDGEKHVGTHGTPDAVYERYRIPETIPLHIGVGEPRQPVPIFSPHGERLIGALIVHGDAPVFWTVADNATLRSLP